jgi:hypothetical protein
MISAGQHVPPDEVSAPGKRSTSTLGVVMGAVGNLLFYGGLVGCTGFWASRYMFSLDDVQQMAAAAEEAEQRSQNIFTQTYAAAVCNYRDARVWCDQKLMEMTGAILFLHCPWILCHGLALRVDSFLVVGVRARCFMCLRKTVSANSRTRMTSNSRRSWLHQTPFKIFTVCGVTFTRSRLTAPHKV